MISIWFFIGVILAVYGALILGAGIYGVYVPADRIVVMADLHMGIWWGAILLAIGIVYTVKFAPRKRA